MAAGRPADAHNNESETKAPNKDGYVLGRGYISAIRMNLQHYLWKSAQGFLLHPSILKQVRGVSGDRQITIADVASGTGNWLLDLLRAPELQGLNIQFRGFDLSPNLFPLKKWLPPSVEFGCADLVLEPPAELHGKFDVVHLRLVVSVARNGQQDVRKIIRHIHKILKPGGFLQWDELDLLGHHQTLTAGSVDPKSTNMDSLLDKIRHSGDYTWVAKLPEILQDEGFEDAAQQSYEPTTETLPSWTCCELCTLEEASMNIVDQKVARMFRAQIELAYQEANDASVGAVLKAYPTVTIARKSS